MDWMSAAPKERYNQQLDDNRWKLKGKENTIRRASYSLYSWS